MAHEKEIQTRIQLNIGLDRPDLDSADGRPAIHREGFKPCPVIRQLSETLREFEAVFFGWTCNALRIERVESLRDGVSNIEHTLAIEWRKDFAQSAEETALFRYVAFDLAKTLGQEAVAHRTEVRNIANGEKLSPDTWAFVDGPRAELWNDGKFDPASFIDPRENAQKLRQELDLCRGHYQELRAVGGRPAPLG